MSDSDHKNSPSQPSFEITDNGDDRLRILPENVSEKKQLSLSENSSDISDTHGVQDIPLDHFLSIAQDLFGVIGSDGVLANISPSFEKTLGYDRLDFLSKTFVEFIHPQDARAVRDILEILNTTQGDDDNSCEVRMLCKGGDILWMRWVFKVIDGQIFATGRDVTHRKNREKELLVREQQLTEAQRIAKMGHWSWVIGQKNVEWSDELYTIFGMKKGDFTPTFSGINKRIHKRDLPRTMQAFERAVIDRRDFTVEFRFTDMAGELKYGLCEGRCHKNERGEVEKLFGIIRDVTDQTLNERALRQAKEAAEQAYQSKSRFLANMSHELRTPLNAIIGFSEMIQRQLLGPIGNDRYLDYIIGIRESGEHLLDLITDILDMSKIEAGKYRLSLEDVNLNKTIRLAVHMMEGRATEGKIKLSFDDKSLEPKITADRRAVMQVLLNLLSNAIKFTPEGGSVTVSYEGDADKDGTKGVWIHVQDTGIGIPKQKLDRVTRPFEQVAGAHTRNHEGSGLGLSITKNLLELHGGDLRLTSEVGKGTTVKVFLPETAIDMGTEGTDMIDDEMLDFDDSVLMGEKDEDNVPIFRQFDMPVD